MKRQILICVEFFEEIIENNYFYIDKTLFIKELLENRGKATLITRPRRFGKTLNMNMLKCFFDASCDNRRLFEGLKIMEYDDIVDKHLGKHPVISLTLKDVEESTMEDSVENIRELISDLYKQHQYILEYDKLEEADKEKFLLLRREKSSARSLKASLKFLMNCLHTYYNKKVVVLIDEYDAPINNALMKGHYQEMIEFMRGFLGGAFKSSESLEFGVLTGVNRISKEGLMSGFNNPRVFGISNDKFATCYGFTEDEVKQACDEYGYGDRFSDIKKWYEGYRFGQAPDMYNPWSITYFLCEGQLRNYWANTGGMSILQDIFLKGSTSLKDDMAGLLTDIPIKTRYVDQITYPITYNNNNAFWSLLLNAGYLKPCAGSSGDDFEDELVNREVKTYFAECIEYWFKGEQRAIHETIQEFVGYLLGGDAGAVARTLNDDLLNNPSCHDFKEENSYHMFIYGILLAVSRDYVVLYNQESGKGRSDCIIKPDDKSKNVVVVEFKHVRGEPQDLKQEAEKGIKQIEEKEFAHNLKNEGYGSILLYGIAFHKKSCEVAMKVDKGS